MTDDEQDVVCAMCGAEIGKGNPADWYFCQSCAVTPEVQAFVQGIDEITH